MRLFAITPATGEKCVVDKCPTPDYGCRGITLNSILLARLVLCPPHLTELREALNQ